MANLTTRPITEDRIRTEGDAIPDADVLARRQFVAFDSPHVGNGGDALLIGPFADKDEAEEALEAAGFRASPKKWGTAWSPYYDRSGRGARIVGIYHPGRSKRLVAFAVEVFPRLKGDEYFQTLLARDLFADAI